ncbi:MAG: tetratricopeptide repeat protein [Bacteroidetes bacterium]|nr:tetratricopeptide repeat protein [Bacteroidota bacterium]
MAQGKYNYSKSDSLKAKAYFDSSWNYSLGSAKHQLYIDSVLQIIPTHSWYWQQKSMPLYKAYKYELGRPFLDSAVKYDAAKWLDYRGFIKCIYERNYRGAIIDFQNAKIINSEKNVMDHPYDFYIGLCYLQLNQLDSSEYFLNAIIKKTIKQHGEDWVHNNHWFYLGIVYYEKENYNKAIECFDHAIKGYAKFSDAKFYKSVCLSELHKSADALALLEQANADYNEGYTIVEDNIFYEYYPYQIKKYYLTAMLAYLRRGETK